MTKINQNQILIGNETVIDLVVNQNEQKENLETILKNNNIDADADTETLAQLVNKVANIPTQGSAVEKAVVADCKVRLDHIISNNINLTFIDKEGWHFYFNDSQTLAWVKISDITGDNNYNNAHNSISAISQYISLTDGTNTYSVDKGGNAGGNFRAMGMSEPTLDSTDNHYYAKLFIATNDGSNNLLVYDVDFGTDFSICTVTFNTVLSITDENSNNKIITSVSSNSDGTKLLLVMEDNNCTYLYNVSTGVNTKILDSNQNTVAYNTGENANYSFTSLFLGDNAFVTVFFYNNVYFIFHYTLSGAVATNVNGNGAFLQSDTISIYPNGFINCIKVYKDYSNKYKVIIPGFNGNLHRGPSLCIYHADTKVFNSYYGKQFCSADYDFDWNNKWISFVSVYSVYNSSSSTYTYYISNGSLDICVFDNSWNNIGNTLVMCKYDNNLQYYYFFYGCIYNGKYVRIFNSYACYIPLYFNKKACLRRTITPTGLSAKTKYYPVIATAEDCQN